MDAGSLNQDEPRDSDGRGEVAGIVAKLDDLVQPLLLIRV